VTRYLIDTNILSDATKPKPSPGIAAWLSAQVDEDLSISTLTLGEIRRGILQQPTGRRRRELEHWFAGPDGLLRLFAGRVRFFGEREAVEWARIMAAGRAEGRPRNPLDMIIAATAAANNCVVVTANDRDFRGAVAVMNPRTGASSE
jgi:toxin FitB